MAELKLTPCGHLRWVVQAGDDSSKEMHQAFETNWIEGLFRLGAEKWPTAGSITLRYWQQLSHHYINALCHIPDSADAIPPLSANESDLAQWLLTAPPMTGGEYLSLPLLKNIWESVDGWVHMEIPLCGGLSQFLSSRAPLWRQVGCVCFHLAENKASPDQPFAFLATYSTGIGASGQLKHLPLGKAMEQYAGAKNRPALIKLLRPVHQAARQCEWVHHLVESESIYHPLTWTPDEAYRLLRDAADIETCGIIVRLPNWWQKRSRPQVSVVIGSQKTARLGAEAVLDFNVGVALGGEHLTEAEVRSLLAGNDGLVLFKGQWVEVNREKLQEALKHWQTIRRQNSKGELSFIEGMRLLAGASADLKQDAFAGSQQEWAHISAGEAMQAILNRLNQKDGAEDPELDSSLKTILRPYQKQGTSWLSFLTHIGLGACLADDMGLGKTLQILALLQKLYLKQKRPRRPSLLVVPASLMSNWRNEANRFTPSLRLAFLHPAETDRTSLEKMLNNTDRLGNYGDLFVTTYSMLTRQPQLCQTAWQLVILDEAQAIRNPSTHQSRAVKQLQTDGRIALTGTPVENRLGDLWSIFDFLNPGLLGSAAVFKEFIKKLEARQSDQYAPLRRLVSPYILRRMKTDRSIISDLPDKIETACYCKLSKAQVRLYEAAVRTLESTLETTEGIARRGAVLSALMRLKQICNHPSQLTGDGQYADEDSGKFLRIREICEEIASRQEKILVFTQFREIIDPLADYLAGIFGRPGLALHGGTAVAKRKDLIAQFQNEDGPPFFILSLKAGGTGLNLTAASHIIHFDRWWNPAVENQATDRAFRIGQKRNVLVHKCITIGTIEERIDAMINEKKKMAEELLTSQDEVNLTEMPNEAILNLVRLDITRAQL